MNQPITGLYVPGDRPDRFAKAVATGAELVVFDLEDAVPPAHKDAARQAVAAYLRSADLGSDDQGSDGQGRAHLSAVARDAADRGLVSPSPPHRKAADLGRVVQVRVNPADTPAGQADLALLRTLPPTVELRLPKVERPSQIDQALTLAGPRPVTALLESPAAVLAAAAIAAVLAAPDTTSDGGIAIAASGGTGIAASWGVGRLGLGESDLSSAFGVRSGPLIDHARLHLAYVAQAAGLPAPMLSPYPDIADLDGL
ncbi:MAG: hypothetical protein LBL55_00230, partial [Propionibacteriaceae bacterium]|nr:hypothetical protein [Propionibacteriaceae bacterium]